MWQQIDSAPVNEDVLIFDGDWSKVCVAHCDPEIWDKENRPVWIVGYGAEYHPKPTHWMPLPELPQTKG